MRAWGTTIVRRSALSVAKRVRNLGVRLARWYGTRRDAVHLAQRAWQAIINHQWSDAIYYGRTAVAADPSYADGHRMLGLAYLGSGDRLGARDAFEEGTRVAPGQLDLLVCLGGVEMELERYGQAEAAYRRALESEPENPDLLLRLAQALRGQRRLEEAETLLEEAHALAPDNRLVRRTLGHVLTERGKYREALSLLDEIVRHEPTNAFSRHYLAHALVGIGKHKEGLEQARKAAELEPDNADYQELYSQLLQSVGPQQNH